MDPHRAVCPERPALRLHPVHHQLPHSADRSRLHPRNLLQACQRASEFSPTTRRENGKGLKWWTVIHAKFPAENCCHRLVLTTGLLKKWQISFDRVSTLPHRRLLQLKASTDFYGAVVRNMTVAPSFQCFARQHKSFTASKTEQPSKLPAVYLSNS